MQSKRPYIALMYFRHVWHVVPQLALLLLLRTLSFYKLYSVRTTVSVGPRLCSLPRPLPPIKHDTVQSVSKYSRVCQAILRAHSLIEAYISPPHLPFTRQFLPAFSFSIRSNSSLVCLQTKSAIPLRRYPSNSSSVFASPPSQSHPME